MQRALRRARERVAGLVLKRVDAGACVPENGRCCSSRNRRFNCYGNCVFSISC